MRITQSEAVTHCSEIMDEKQQEPLDLVKDFQEYLNQQTHHVNMISGSVDEDRDPEDLHGAAGEDDPTGLDHASIEVSLDEGALANSFERTDDGKLKCRYCNYGSRGIQRLIEHIRIHTGEKPHRCRLCPFASAYERHLESHMRSHTGEKPYKCDLCSFRCSDRSNLSHHRRRRHKVLSTRVAHHSALASKKILKRSSSLAFSRRHLISLSPPSMVVQKHLNGFPALHADVYENLAKSHNVAVNTNVQSLILDNPLDQLSTLAGQLANLPAQDPHCSASEEQDADSSCRDEKPMLISPLPGLPPASTAQPPSASTPDLHSQSTNSQSYSQPGTPVPASASTSASAQTSSNPPETLFSCSHCQVYFADNILYTIHMGCHGYEKPFQCNVCGCQCRDRYDFACHFARGHNQP